jgi:hypothetical protein
MSNERWTVFKDYYREPEGSDLFTDTWRIPAGWTSSHRAACPKRRPGGLLRPATFQSSQLVHPTRALSSPIASSGSVAVAFSRESSRIAAVEALGGKDAKQPSITKEKAPSWTRGFHTSPLVNPVI